MIGIQIAASGGSQSDVALVAGCYSLGFIIGCFVAPSRIQRAGLISLVKKVSVEASEQKASVVDTSTNSVEMAEAGAELAEEQIEVHESDQSAGPGMILPGCCLPRRISPWITERMNKQKAQGVTGLDALTRIMGFLLICIAFQFVFDGIGGYFGNERFLTAILEQLRQLY